ncbi:uncharacterized protein LOC129763333 [Toxorhynchites rutilus septentrionalis]|uniref:uncharacterized protein LOC129763333 n=1 Tax=Toxorhynchites rutilus septentrionalis TaxID=329112 RepID=UPI00247990E9|nr:uncharacterized protein LOC129763333 [Toxorhynchites rutilus septentrionalis]
MKASISLGVCVLCCLVALIAAGPGVVAFEYEQNDKHPTTTKNKPNSAKSANYGTDENNLEPVLEYVPNEQPMNGHQYEKRETVTHPTTMEVLQPDLQQHLRDRRLPLYIDEPKYIVLRRPTDFLQSSPGFSFIPQRGRKSDSAALLRKRELSIKQMLDGGDYFFPNRGKKWVGNGITKKVKFDDILGSDELFIPNRGKKELLDLYPPPPTLLNGRRLLNDLQPFFSKKNVLGAIQKVGSKDQNEGDELFFPTRGKKNILDSLAQNQDVFFSSRGKRNPIIWSMLTEPEANSWEYLLNENSSYDGNLLLDRYRNNKAIA